MVKCPAAGPPSRWAKTAAESGSGWQNQLTVPSGVSSALERGEASMVSRSMRGADAPASQVRRSSSRNARALATSSVLGTRYSARLSPSPTLMPISGPDSRAKAFSSVTSSPKKTAAEAPS
ncbi:Uncharacterised protein [Nocardia africana]|uniref:Uncharacterized protein n=1 Tax=Nocardia africana TaxID=134964 RepID=A0A378WL21_9NOCA|nr:Uncharacterised protein [Nocardia africana]